MERKTCLSHFRLAAGIYIRGRMVLFKKGVLRSAKYSVRRTITVIILTFYTHL